MRVTQTKYFKKQEQTLVEELGIGKETKECQQTREKQLTLVTNSWNINNMFTVDILKGHRPSASLS